MSDGGAEVELEALLKDSASSSALLTRTDSSSILTRVESFTSEPKPALALVQFAEKLGTLSQQLPKQRLVWSKQSARLSRHLRSGADVQCQRPHSIDSVPPKTGGAPSSARRVFRRHRPHEMCSAQVTPRTPSFPSKYEGGQEATVEGAEEPAAVSQTWNWPFMERVEERARQRHARTGRGGRRLLTPLVVSKPQTASSEPLPRTPSTRGLMRLAEACAEAGLFIIPDAPMPTPAVHNILSESPEVSEEHALPPEISTPEPVPEESEASISPKGMRALGFVMSKLAKKRAVAQPTLDNASTEPGQDDQGQTPSTANRWVSAVSRLTHERYSSMMVQSPGSLQAVIQQAMTKEISEQPKAEHRDREKRLRWQQQHMQMMSQLGELIKTLQDLQPPEETKEIAEPLQMLKMMMGMGENKEKEEKKEVQEEPDKPEVLPLASRESMTVRKSRFDSNGSEYKQDSSRGSIGAGSIICESGDPSDMSLPPLCGPVQVRRRKSSSGKDACKLALSCHQQKKRASVDDSHDEFPPEHELGRIFRKFKPADDLFGVRRESSANDGPSGHTREYIKGKWKRNIQLARMFGRLSHHPTNIQHEEPGLVHELASVRDLMSHEEAQHLAMLHNLPLDRVIRCRKMFARADRDNRGDLAPQDLQNLLREMWKDMHPKTTVMPHALFGSQNQWAGRTKFTEVLRWLSRHSFDEATLVPQETRRTREFARQWGVDIAEVEEVKDLFDRFDTEKSGFLEFNNFKSALSAILKVPRGIDVPNSRVNISWKEVDQGKTGKVPFENFFWWYKRSGFSSSAGPRDLRASFGGNFMQSPKNVPTSNFFF